MPVIRVETEIDGPPAVCFDAARDVDLHTRSTATTRERAVPGPGQVTAGLLSLGDEVTWEAWHLGVRQRLTTRITRFEPPRLFEDVQVRGPFHAMTHTHEFRSIGVDGRRTRMVDTFQYTSPAGVLGRLADVLFLERYLRRFLTGRAAFLKAAAEARAGARG